MLSRTACGVLAVLTVLLLGACADSPAEGPRLRGFTELVRGYDHTLTKSEKAAVISDLKNEQQRQQKSVARADGTEEAPATE